ncbi:hypothetical protein [Microbacterium sp. SLBN-111]
MASLPSSLRRIPSPGAPPAPWRFAQRGPMASALAAGNLDAITPPP